MRKFSRKFKTGASAVAVLVVLFGVYGFRKFQALAADPAGEKDCRPPVGGGEQGKIDLERIKAIAPLKDVNWSQLGGSINDASCLNKTEIYGVVEVKSAEDIGKALAFARENKLSVTTAGVRHSMGGHAFRKGGIVLDMRGFNKIVLNESARASRCSRAPPGTTSRTCCIRALRSAPCSRPTFSRSAARSRSTPTAWTTGRRDARSIKSMRVMLADGAAGRCRDREQGSVRPRRRRLRPVRRHP